MTATATTSDLRRWLCEHICTAVMNGSIEWKRWLARQLDVMPFERMTDDALIAFARKVLTEADVERALFMLDAEPWSEDRYERCVGLVLCPACRDQRIIEVEPGRWGRCERCNPAPEPPEPGAKFRGKR